MKLQKLNPIPLWADLNDECSEQLMGGSLYMTFGDIRGQSESSATGGTLGEFQFVAGDIRSNERGGGDWINNHNETCVELD